MANRLRCLGFGAVLALLASIAPAVANERLRVRDSADCRRSCNAAHAGRLRNPREVQVCLIRCTGDEEHLAKQSRPSRPGAAQPRAVGAPIPPPPATPAPSAPVLIVHAGRAPSRAVAISAVGLTRDNAYRVAEAACYASNGGRPCNLLGETGERCVAVAEGRRPLGIVNTDHASTGLVLHHNLGSSADPSCAEFDALSACGTRMIGRVTGCHVVAERCR